MVREVKKNTLVRTTEQQRALKQEFDARVTSEETRIRSETEAKVQPISQKIEETKRLPSDQFPNKMRDVKILERQVQRIRETGRQQIKEVRGRVADDVFGKDLNITGREVQTDSKEKLQREANIRIAERQGAIKRFSSTRTTREQRDFIREQANVVESDGSEVGKARAERLREGLRIERQRTRSLNPDKRAERFEKGRIEQLVRLAERGKGMRSLAIGELKESGVQVERGEQGIKIRDPQNRVKDFTSDDFTPSKKRNRVSRPSGDVLKEQRRSAASYYAALDKRGVTAKDIIPRKSPLKDDGVQGTVVGGFTSVDGTETSFILPTSIPVSLQGTQVTKKVEGGFAFTSVKSVAPVTTELGAGVVTQEFSVISKEDAKINKLVDKSLFPTLSSKKAAELRSQASEDFTFIKNPAGSRSLNFDNVKLNEVLNREIRISSDSKKGQALGLEFLSPIENIASAATTSGPQTITVSEGTNNETKFNFVDFINPFKEKDKGRTITFGRTTEAIRQEGNLELIQPSEVLQTDFDPITTAKIVEARRQRIDQTPTLGGVLPRDPITRENVFSVADLALLSGSVTRAGISAARSASTFEIVGSQAGRSALGKQAGVSKFTIDEIGFGASPPRQRFGTVTVTQRGTGFEQTAKSVFRGQAVQRTFKGRVISEVATPTSRVDLLQIGDEAARLSTIEQLTSGQGGLRITGVEDVSKTKGFFGKPEGVIVSGSGSSQVGGARVGVRDSGLTLNPKRTPVTITEIGQGITEETFGKSRGLFKANNEKAREVSASVGKLLGLQQPRTRKQVLEDLIQSKRGEQRLRKPEQRFDSKLFDSRTSSFNEIQGAVGSTLARRSVTKVRPRSLRTTPLLTPSFTPPKSSLSSNSDLSILSIQTQAQRTGLESAQGQEFKLREATATQQSFETQLKRERTPLLSTPSLSTFGRATPTPRKTPTPLIPPLIPPFNLPLGQKGTGKKIKTPKVKRKLTPDLFSLEFAESGKTIGGVSRQTGFQARRLTEEQAESFVPTGKRFLDILGVKIK